MIRKTQSSLLIGRSYSQVYFTCVKYQSTFFFSSDFWTLFCKTQGLRVLPAQPRALTSLWPQSRGGPHTPALAQAHPETRVFLRDPKSLPPCVCRGSLPIAFPLSCSKKADGAPQAAALRKFRLHTKNVQNPWKMFEDLVSSLPGARGRPDSFPSQLAIKRAEAFWARARPTPRGQH